MRLFRKTRTKPLPEGAVIQEKKSGRVAVWMDGRGQKKTAPVTEGPGGELQIVFEDKVWYHRYRDAQGILREISTGCRDRNAAEAKVRDILNRVEKIKAGIISPEEEGIVAASGTKLETHFAAFERYLEGKTSSPYHVKKTLTRLRAIANDTQATTLRTLSFQACQNWMSTQATEGMAAQTRNNYRAALNNFGNWAVRTGILSVNPFTKLTRANVRADRRHIRRAYTLDDARRLLYVARWRPLAERGREVVTVTGAKRSNWTYVPLTWETLDAAIERARTKLKPELVERLEQLGRERELIYRVLLATGLRKGELSKILIGDVDLDAGCIHLPAPVEKNREGSDIPLRKDLQELLRLWIAAKRELHSHKVTLLDAGKAKLLKADLLLKERLFVVPGALDKLINRDLMVAGIAKADRRGHVLDAHALRMTFGTYLSAAGVPLRIAQAAMRHSDPKLTANVYTDPLLLDVTGAIESLPDIDTQAKGGDKKAVGDSEPRDESDDPHEPSSDA